MSSNSVNPIACTLCGAGGHRERACPDLHPPPDGFWKGERMPDDEDDDCCKEAVLRIFIYNFHKQQKRKRNNTSYNAFCRKKLMKRMVCK